MSLSALGLLGLVLAWLLVGESDGAPRPAHASDPATEAPASPGATPLARDAGPRVAHGPPSEDPAARVLVRGRVVDTVGGPVEGAWVRVRDKHDAPLGSARSDAEGEFVVRDREPPVRDDALVWISASADGYATATLATAAPTTAAELTLIPTSTVAGIVVTEAGDPVPDVLVELRPPPLSLLPSWPQARSDAEGRFEITGVGVGRYRPTIEDGPWLATHPGVDVEPLTRHDDVRVVAEAGHPLTVRVLAPDGSPCPEPGAWIAGLRRRGRAGSEPGAWQLAGLPVGEHEVHATCPDAREVAATVALPTDEALTVQTDAGLTVTGRVVDEHGVTVADAEVRLATRGRAHTSFTTQTDARGQFELAGLAPDRYAVDASHAQFQPSEPSELVLAEADPSPFVELTLARGECLRVRVRGPAEPTLRVMITAHAPPGLPVRQRTRADGTAELCGFAEDAEPVVALHDPRGHVPLPFVVEAEPTPDPDAHGRVSLAGPAAFAGPVTFALAATPDRTIEVRLDGDAEALVVLQAVEATANPNCDGDPWSIDILTQAITVAGVHRFEGLWPGRYLVRANAGGRRDCAIVELDPRASERSTTVELRPPPP